MKKRCLPVALLFLYHSAVAQLGLTVAPTSSLSPKWQILVENFTTEHRTRFLEYGATGIIDYHVPLKNLAWSIRPAIHGMSTSFHHREYHFSVYSVGFQPNVNFELFAQEGPSRKTLRPFLQFSPGLNYVHKQFLRPVNQQGEFIGIHQKFTDTNWAVNVGLNFLLDIRLTTLLSVAPQLGYRYFPEVEWKGFTEQVSDGQITRDFDKTDWRQFTFGLRIGLDLENGIRR